MKLTNLLISMFFLSTMLFSSCAEEDDVEEDVCSTFEWEYDAGNTPDIWGSFCTSCDGTVQSPIDITGAVVDASLNVLETNYEAVTIKVERLKHTMEFEYEEETTEVNELTLNGLDYKLLQFHFHTSSEHTVNGEQYPMEVHLVHKNASTGNYAVIGILFEEGDENTVLANFTDDLPTVVGEVFTSENMLNAADLLPADEAYFTYGGSLTTPPCYEKMTWMVMKMPMQASAAQIQNIHNIIQDNFRPIQALNGRTIGEFN